MEWARLWTGATAWLAERRPAPPPSLEIASERLRLREFREQDVEAIYAHRGDPEVLRFLDRIHPYNRWEVSMAIARALQERREQPRHVYQLGIIQADEERLIGECRLDLFYGDPTVTVPDAANLGFMLRRPYWGHAYATEAAAALLRFAFVELQLKTVQAGCLPQNHASRRVLEKIGLAYRGVEKEFPGSPSGTEALVFQLDRDAWLTKHPPTAEVHQEITATQE